MFACAPAVFAPSDSADPYWANVVLLVDASSYTNGSTPSTIDVKGKTPTYRNNAQVKTDQFKFGTSSLYFDGTNDRVSFPDSNDWAMNTGNATWEAWVRPEGSFTGGQRFFLGQAASTGAVYSALLRRNTNDDFQAGVGDGGANYEGQIATMPSDTWVHVALVRSGGNVFGSINGVVTLLATPGAITMADVPGPMTLGGYADADHATNFKGWMDQVRITKGVARYTNNFTAPTAPFPHS